MSGVTFCSPLPVAAITASRGSGPARLLTPDPREAFVDTAAGSAVTITLDLGTASVVDTVYLGFTNGGTARWSATGGVNGTSERSLFADQPFAVPAGVNAPAGYARFDPVAVRYVALTVVQPAGNAPLQAGIVTVARALRPTWGHEWGSGRGLLDLSPKTRHAGGGFGIGPGVRKATWSATLGDLTDDEVAGFWALVRRHGESQPLLVVEDDARTPRLGDRLHWCVVDRIEPYDRRSVGRTRWAVRFEDWL